MTRATCAILSVAYALVVLAGVRLLALVVPIGTLVVMELARVVLVGGGAGLTACIVLRKTPSVGRCTIAGALAGIVVGVPAMGVGAIPEPTDTFGIEVVLVTLVCLGAVLGLILGLIFGLLFAVYAALALHRDFAPRIVAAAFVGAAGALSALLHATEASLDVLGIAMLVLAALGFGVVALERSKAYLGAVVLASLVVVAAVELYRFKDAAPPAWSSTPIPIARGRALTNFAGTDSAMCALRADHHLACWGRGAGPLLGKKHPAYRTPEAHAKLGALRSFAITEDGACGVPDAGDHRAVCWTTKDSELRPIGPPDVVEIVMGTYFTVALTASGSVWSWSKNKPEQVGDLPPIAHVAASRYHVVALARDGMAYCWGDSFDGQCGVKQLGLSPTKFSGGPFDAIAARSTSTALHAGGKWQTYGAFYGVERSSHDTHDVRQVAVSDTDTCALSENGSVTCTRGTASPTRVFEYGVTDIVGSKDGYCAQTTHGLYCWSGYSLLLTVFE